MGESICSPPLAPPRTHRLRDPPFSLQFGPARVRNGFGDPIWLWPNRVRNGVLGVSHSACCVFFIISACSCAPPPWSGEADFGVSQGIPRSFVVDPSKIVAFIACFCFSRSSGWCADSSSAGASVRQIYASAAPDTPYRSRCARHYVCVLFVRCACVCVYVCVCVCVCVSG